MIAEVKNDFWDYTITVVTDGDIEKVIQDDLILEIADIDNSVMGRSIMMPSGEVIMWLNTDASEDESSLIGTIAHESVHIARHILHNVQHVPMTDETEEVYARLVGLLTKQVFEVL